VDTTLRQVSLRWPMYDGSFFLTHNTTLSAATPTPFPQTGLPAPSSIGKDIDNIQPHQNHLPRRRPRPNLKEKARTVVAPPIPGSTLTSTTTTHADTNVESKTSGGPAVEIRPNQVSPIGSRSSRRPWFCQRSPPISTCSRVGNRGNTGRQIQESETLIHSTPTGTKERT